MVYRELYIPGAVDLFAANRSLLDFHNTLADKNQTRRNQILFLPLPSDNFTIPLFPVSDADNSALLPKNMYGHPKHGSISISGLKIQVNGLQIISGNYDFASSIFREKNDSEAAIIIITSKVPVIFLAVLDLLIKDSAQRTLITSINLKALTKE